MFRISRTSCVGAVTALVAALVLGACPGPDREVRDSTGTDRGSSEVRYPYAVAGIPVLEAEADAGQRAGCFARTFSNGNTVRLGSGQTVRILAHDSTTAYEAETLESGEHFIAMMIDMGGTGLEDYALAPGDSTCWAVRTDSIGAYSVFYGRDKTVMRPLTIEFHSQPHRAPEADWIVERRYPSSFRRFDSTAVAPVSSSWLPPFLAPNVAYASTALVRDVTDQGGSGPWTTCIRYGCCKPR